VLHLGSNNVVQLGDKTVPDVTLSQHKRYMLASSDLPYRKMITWAGFYQDYYLVDINTGRKLPLLTQQPSDAEPSLSGDGKYVAYYQQGHVYLYDIAEGRRTNLMKIMILPPMRRVMVLALGLRTMPASSSTINSMCGSLTPHRKWALP